jgi:ABC-2 type transport system permease protein/lipopolysaccharide transport system permease protein
VALYADLFRYRELFLNLFRRELRVRYRGSLLGLAWSLVNPLALVGVYTLVFSVLWRAFSIPHYPLFVVSGLVVWIFFQSSLQTASASLLGHANLLKQVRFPRQLLPLAVVGTNLVSLAVMLAVVLPLNLAFVPQTRSTFWAGLLMLLPLVGLVSGLGIVVAAATVVFRDVEHLLATVLLPWFFLTPVFYTFEQLPRIEEHARVADFLHYANFVTPVLLAIRDPLFFGRLPAAGDAAYAATAALAALGLGALVFRRVDDQLAVAL